MIECDLIGDLPKAVVCYFLRSWLTVAEVCHLDSACCNKLKRQYLIQELFDDKNIFVNSHWFKGNDRALFIKWIVLRKIRLSSLNLCSSAVLDIDKRTLLLLFRLNGAKLKEIYTYTESRSLSSEALPINVYDVISTCLFACSSVEVLTFCGQTINDSFSMVLFIMQGTLRKLTLHNCKNVNARNFAGIHCSTLESLDLSQSVTNDMLVAAAAAFPNVKRLYFHHGSDMRIGLTAIASNSYIQSFDASSNCLLAADDLLAIVENSPQLTSVNIEDCFQITDACIMQLALHCTKLTELTVGSPLITNQALVTLSVHLKMLTTLDITCCKECTQTGVITLVKGCTNLLNLTISRSEVGNRSLAAIASHCVILQKLTLRYHYWCVPGIEAVLGGCAHLQSLETDDDCECPCCEEGAEIECTCLEDDRNRWQAMYPLVAFR